MDCLHRLVRLHQIYVSENQKIRHELNALIAPITLTILCLWINRACPLRLSIMNKSVDVVSSNMCMIDVRRFHWRWGWYSLRHAHVSRVNGIWKDKLRGREGTRNDEIIWRRILRQLIFDVLPWCAITHWQFIVWFASSINARDGIIIINSPSQIRF